LILELGIFSTISQKGYSFVDDDITLNFPADQFTIDTTSPTLGLTSQGIRVVTDGFTYNGSTLDVDYFFTPYPLVTVQISDENIAELKIFEDRGPEQIRHVELAFGLSKGQYVSQSSAVISYDIDYQGNGVVSQIDPENIIDDDTLKVEHKIVKCTELSYDEKCLLVKIYHTFRSPLDFDIVGTNIWDTKRNSWQNFFNHGIRVEGQSLNTEKGILVNNGSLRLYPLTDDSNNVRVMIDENNILYILTPNGNYEELRNNASLFHEIDESMYNFEEFSSHGIDRHDPKFKEYQTEQNQIAQVQLNAMINSQSIANPYFGVNDNEQIIEGIAFTGATPELLEAIEHRIDRHDPKFKEYQTEQNQIAQVQLNAMINSQSIANPYFGVNDNEEIIEDFTPIRFTPELLEVIEHEKLKAEYLFDILFNIKQFDDQFK
jgi:hypothetical protein